MGQSHCYERGSIVQRGFRSVHSVVTLRVGGIVTPQGQAFTIPRRVLAILRKAFNRAVSLLQTLSPMRVMLIARPGTEAKTERIAQRLRFFTLPWAEKAAWRSEERRVGK